MQPCLVPISNMKNPVSPSLFITPERKVLHIFVTIINVRPCTQSLISRSQRRQCGTRSNALLKSTKIAYRRPSFT